jgi:hypothetical protein
VSAELVARLAAGLVGVVFAWAGAAKLATLVRWIEQARVLGVPDPIIAIVPLAELALAVLLVGGWGSPWAIGAAAAMLVAFTVLLLVRLRDPAPPPCSCFGGRSDRPLGWADVARNVALLAALGAAWVASVR